RDRQIGFLGFKAQVDRLEEGSVLAAGVYGEGRDVRLVPDLPRLHLAPEVTRGGAGELIGIAQIIGKAVGGAVGARPFGRIVEDLVDVEAAFCLRAGGAVVAAPGELAALRLDL